MKEISNISNQGMGGDEGWWEDKKYVKLIEKVTWWPKLGIDRNFEAKSTPIPREFEKTSNKNRKIVQRGICKYIFFKFFGGGPAMERWQVGGGRHQREEGGRRRERKWKR